MSSSLVWQHCNQYYQHAEMSPFEALAATCSLLHKRAAECADSPPVARPAGRELQCPFVGCGKVYTKPVHLTIHVRRHTGERPYRCVWPTCDRSFSRSDELARHTRTHRDDRRHACPVCGKRFLRPDHMRKHVKTHGAKSVRRRAVTHSTRTSGDSCTSDRTLTRRK